MPSAWSIEWAPSALKDLEKLGPSTAKRVYLFVNNRVAGSQDPRALGKRMKGELRAYWRYRVGDYRVLCRIEDDRLVVLVVAVGHRGEIYRG